MEELVKVVWKTLAAFVVLIILARFLGKKLLSQMTFAEFVIAISIGSISGAFVVNEVRGYWVLLSPLILAVATVGISFIGIKSLAFRKLSEGEPIIVIKNGKIMESNMYKARYSLNDLEMQLRENGIFDITEVEFAVLESNGELSVLKKAQYQPVTMEDLDKPTPYKGLASDIIKNGYVLEENLKQNKLDFGWLYNELNKRGIERLEDVMYASLQPDGSLYTDIRDDLEDAEKKDAE